MKEVICAGCGQYESECRCNPQPLPEKRVTCMECMGDKYKKRNCKHCQGKGYLIFVSAQPLDDKELREKLAKDFEIARQEGPLTRFADGFADADDVLALLPNIEEELRIGNKLTATLTDKCRELELQIEEAKRKERERIIKYLEDNMEKAFGIPYITYKVLQTLKGGE